MNMYLNQLYGIRIQPPRAVVQMACTAPADPPLFGMPVFEDYACVRTVVRRVPGGYMNRWLVREVATVPAWVVVDGAIFIHPTLMPALKEFAKRGGA